MRRPLTAIIEREGDGYVALCPEADGESQGERVAEVRANLEQAVEPLFFETASPGEVSERLGGEMYVTGVEAAAS